MNKCLVCKKGINRPKFCSHKCSAHAWYLRNNPKAKSYKVNSAFWKTETGIGFKWEKYVAKFLKAEHLKFNKGGADLKWNGKMVDVKSSNLYRRKNKRGKPVLSKQSGVWVFNRGKNKPLDFFFCVALKNNKPFKMLLIPNDNFPKKGLVIGMKSKYDKYLCPFMPSSV